MLVFTEVTEIDLQWLGIDTLNRKYYATIDGDNRRIVPALLSTLFAATTLDEAAKRLGATEPGGEQQCVLCLGVALTWNPAWSWVLVFLMPSSNSLPTLKHTSILIHIHLVVFLQLPTPLSAACQAKKQVTLVDLKTCRWDNMRPAPHSSLPCSLRITSN